MGRRRNNQQSGKSKIVHKSKSGYVEIRSIRPKAEPPQEKPLKQEITEETKKEWQANVDRIKDQFGKATSTAQVDDMWRENKVVYDKLPKKDQVVVMEEFKRIKTYLKENEDAA